MSTSIVLKKNKKTATGKKKREIPRNRNKKGKKTSFTQRNVCFSEKENVISHGYLNKQ